MLTSDTPVKETPPQDIHREPASRTVLPDIACAIYVLMGAWSLINGFAQLLGPLFGAPSTSAGGIYTQIFGVVGAVASIVYFVIALSLFRRSRRGYNAGLVLGLLSIPMLLLSGGLDFLSILFFLVYAAAAILIWIARREFGEPRARTRTPAATPRMVGAITARAEIPITAQPPIAEPAAGSAASTMTAGQLVEPSARTGAPATAIVSAPATGIPPRARQIDRRKIFVALLIASIAIDTVLIFGAVLPGILFPWPSLYLTLFWRRRVSADPRSGHPGSVGFHRQSQGDSLARACRGSIFRGDRDSLCLDCGVT